MEGETRRESLVGCDGPRGTRSGHARSGADARAADDGDAGSEGAAATSSSTEGAAAVPESRVTVARTVELLSCPECGPTHVEITHSRPMSVGRCGRMRRGVCLKCRRRFKEVAQSIAVSRIVSQVTWESPC